MNEPYLPPTGVDKDRDRRGRRARRRRTSLTIVVAVALAIAAVAALAAIQSARHGGVLTSASRPADGRSFTVTQASALASPASTSAITARVDPGLVNITVANGSTGAAGEATGMVLTPSGVVLTNNHVVQGATQISATDVGNGKTYAATVVGYDRSGDVALIQLQGASGLRTVPLGDSATVAVASKVTALGNAGGGGGTPRIAQGAIMGLGQTITASDIGGGNSERLDGLIQTSAAVMPGDSGGPLVNDGGQVVGMDAAASSGNTTFVSQSSEAQGFAIPIDSALAIAKQIESGTSSATVHVGPTGFLGVEVVPSSQFAEGFGNAAGSQPQGALVGGALTGYPAATLGLAQGDVITSVNGQAVASATALTDLLSAHHPGDSVQIQWTDTSGQAHTGTVKLASGPAA